MKRVDIRNVALIAHVDHGKTTLVDEMMRQSGLFRREELERLAGGQHGLILDSNELERQRGITILAKNIALNLGGTKVNIIDTPGHADFGGEVERVMKLADGCLLLVDAAEGPLPQTRFVLRKAFENGLKPIVVINKIDRPDGRRVEISVKQLYVFDRLGRTEADEVGAGDICAVVGIEGFDIGDTLADLENAVALPPVIIDEPTLDMTFRINDSPFAGQEGTYVTSRQLRDRLMKELESNVALKVVPSEEKREEFHVSGRGLLPLSILIENMRREGFELSVGKPRVINKIVGGKTMEPIEYLVIEVPNNCVGAVMELVGNRRAECVKLDSRAELTHIEFTIPARGLIGLRTRLLNATSGQAILHHNFYDYQPMRGAIPS